MVYPTTTIGAVTIANGVTTVDCQKQVRSWRLLRSIVELLIPSCNCVFVEEEDIKEEGDLQNQAKPHPTFTPSATIIGTIFGYRRGKVKLCIQTTSKPTNPVLLLEFAATTTAFAREMEGGSLRIALECATPASGGAVSSSLLSTPVWTMYCNGKKLAGHAVKRQPSKADFKALGIMSTVVVGAGIIRRKELNSEDELLYLRANFERVCRSVNSESFHLIDPDRSIGQELSIFFFRSA